MTDTLTKEQLVARLAEIDKAHFGLTESLDRAPAEFQESTSGDDDATESEPLNQRLAEIRRELEALEAERGTLQTQLATLEKAA
jgi:chromosome segregation ATPase